MTDLPFAPPAGQQAPLPNNAKATAQFARLLDALVILDAEGSCRVADLAERVGLQPERLRQLLSVFMTAGAEALEDSAPLAISFGTEAGPLSGDEEDDDAQASADVVWLEAGERGKGWLVSDLGRRPVLVKDVARALLSASLVLSDDALAPDRRQEVEALVERLSAAMRTTVQPPVGSASHKLREAITERRVVRFRYHHPWLGEVSTVVAEPYDLRRQRERLVLDAGCSGALRTFDVSGVSDVVMEVETFHAPPLPARSERTQRFPVVLRVPIESPAERRLESSWGAVVAAAATDGHVLMRIQVDGDPADLGVQDRLGVLLLQLGPEVTVESPADLRGVAAPVAKRLLKSHGG